MSRREVKANQVRYEKLFVVSRDDFMTELQSCVDIMKMIANVIEESKDNRSRF